MARRQDGRGPLLGACLLLAALLWGALPVQAEFAFSDAVVTDEPAEQRLVDLAWSGERLFAAGELGLITYSDDLGETWQQASVPVSITLTAITFTPNGTGWAVGHGGVILRGDDGGQTWVKVFDGYQANEQFLAYAKRNKERLEEELAALEAQEDPDPEALDELDFALENAIFALDDAGFAVETGPADPFLDVMFTSDSDGFAIGAYGMFYRTEDGGESWQLDVDGIDNGYRNHLYSLERSDSGRLHMSGEAGLLYYSDDDGHSWTRTRDVYDGSLFRVLPAGDSLYAMGLRGNLFRSSDDGASWQRVAGIGEGSLYAGVATASGELYFVGVGGRILLSRDNGASFTEVTHPSRASLADADVRDGKLYLVSGTGFIREDLGELGHE